MTVLPQSVQSIYRHSLPPTHSHAVQLAVFNLLGQRVATLVAGELQFEALFSYHKSAGIQCHFSSVHKQQTRISTVPSFATFPSAHAIPFCSTFAKYYIFLLI